MMIDCTRVNTSGNKEYYVRNLFYLISVIHGILSNWLMKMKS